MEDKILDFLAKYDKAKDLEEIYSNVNGNFEELKVTISNLVEKGIVHETKKNKYILMKYCKSLRSGKLDITKHGYGFLVLENEEDIYIGKDNLNGAINGDFVLVDTYKRNGREEGRVLRVLNRNLKTVIGEIIYNKNKFLLKAKNVFTDSISINFRKNCYFFIFLQ